MRDGRLEVIVTLLEGFNVGIAVGHAHVIEKHQVLPVLPVAV
jgi:hypothetical protein